MNRAHVDGVVLRTLPPAYYLTICRQRILRRMRTFGKGGQNRTTYQVFCSQTRLFEVLKTFAKSFTRTILDYIASNKRSHMRSMYRVRIYTTSVTVTLFN